MERRLATILAVDIVGYSSLMREDEEATLADLIAFRQQVDELAKAHGGRTFGAAGDSMLAEFSSPVEAVRCSIKIQSTLIDTNRDRQNDRQLQLRIGVNLGDVLAEGENLYGDGVNVAARMESLSEPGGICLSGSAHEQVRDRVDIIFEDMGDQEVKNINRPVRAWRWKPQTASAPMTKAVLPLPDKPSIVVLPFNNMSRDPEQEYFSDGISEDIITDLSKVSGLFVIARNSAFVYKGKTINIRDACSELGVRYALEGSIRKAGNRVRITAQLIDGTSGGHLWAERYDRDLTDIFEVQDDVTQRIVTELKITLTPTEESLMGESGTRNMEAHDCFLRGRSLFFSGIKNTAIFEEINVLFRRAIELDPDYGAPFAGLAITYIQDYQNGWSNSPGTSLNKSEQFVQEALARDDNDPFTHWVASTSAMLRKDHRRWRLEADKALSLNPNYAPALNSRGNSYTFAGEPSKAIPHLERAMRLDPVYQQQYMHFLGTAHFVAGDYETAAVVFKDRISLKPSTDLTRSFLTSALGHLGRDEEARKIWKELFEINANYSHCEHINRLPFKNSADAAKFAEGLRKAGIVPN